MAEAGNLKLDFMAKKHRNSISLLWSEYILRCCRETKITETLLDVWTLKLTEQFASSKEQHKNSNKLLQLTLPYLNAWQLKFNGHLS